MKKILAVMMAIVMMMAIAVPAFAANPITETSDKTGDALVKTDASAIGAGTFTVTYPAEIVVTWGQTKDFTYDVETQLAVKKLLTVTVTDKTTTTLTGTMTNADTTDVLDYTLSGDTTVTAEEVSETTNTVTVTVADWNKAIAEYSGYVTFTAALSDVA